MKIVEIDIKCLKCGKITTNFDLGNIFYTLNEFPKDVVIANVIICPKCKKDVSNNGFALKKHYLMMAILTANICARIEEKVPHHLKGSYCIEEKDFNKIIRQNCKSVPKVVENFN